MGVLDVIWAPARAMERLTREGGGAAAGFGIVALWAALSLLSAALEVFLFPVEQQFSPEDFPQLPPELFEGELLLTARVLAVVFAVLLPFIWWIAVSLVMQLATRIFGGSGPLSNMLAIVGVACLPLALETLVQMPLTGLQLAAGPDSPVGVLLGLLGFLILLGSGIWHVALVIVGSRFARQLSYGESGGACALSCVGCGGLILLAITIVVVLVVTLAGTFGGG
ncbi:hypothetical protein E0L93_04065 [Rubrobacter taiwanensis]|uniref:Yip1 domain-containing protein n=1 Tax=Rubrobacter taiwanensis TaxID=185139 RepID=A0A4R1BQ75_9ACTN|nr:YIP1 family protein [Rubrobacter taiwanensis]TCJ19688.1 hypothetical protein E0L93_04065 [Rubrobacter taiwanensis]